MPPLDAEEPLYHLAVLYLMMAHEADAVLSDAELQMVVERLQARHPALTELSVRDAVMQALEAFTEGSGAEKLVAEATEALARHLTEAERIAVMTDLAAVAGADGIVLDPERRLLARLAEQWDLEAPSSGTPMREDWSVVHDLALLYLYLAHGTDHELSGTEGQVIFNKLREWVPGRDAGTVRRLLDAAKARYAAGFDENALARAVHAVRDGLPIWKRKAAVDDLVQIANADGLFLDNEEDLINTLLSAWNLQEP